MKKLILLLIVSCAALWANAQNLSFGPTAGIGHSWISTNNGSLKTMFHPSYNFGGKLVYSFQSNWGVSGDIKFSREGQTTGVDNNTKIAYNINYIRVPLQVIYFFGEFGDRIRPKLSAGPSLAFKVGGKTKEYYNNNVVIDIANYKVNPFDLGINISGGLNVRVARATWLNADISYYHGLLNVYDQYSGKNRNIGVNIGVTFPVSTVSPDRFRHHK